MTSRVPKGDALYERALRTIPWGTQTGSKRPAAELRGVAPPYIVKGKGCRIWDLDGNDYIDYKMACGPIILGHAYDRVNAAATEQMASGAVHSAAHPVEVELAEELTRTVPCAEMVRFLKSGAEVTSAAVRIARAHTGREKVISSGYHGWHDWSLPGTKGVPAALRELTVSVPWDAGRLEEALERHRGQVACFILSVPYDRTEGEIRDFLRAARALTEREGVLLVYDEIVTGFRLAMGGAQERFGVIPDLAAFSKAMANGFPIGAVVGRKDVMSAWEGVTISSTFGGEAFSMAAALATIAELREKRAHEQLWEAGTRLMNGINAMASDLGLGIRAEGLAPVFSVRFEGKDAEEGRRFSVAFQRELLMRGIMPYSVWYITYSHFEKEIGRTLQVIREAMEGMKREM